MTVYELIQELAKYDADMDVEVSVYAENFAVDAVAKEDAEDGKLIDAEVDIDEYTDDFSVEDYKKYTGKHVVRINVALE